MIYIHSPELIKKYGKPLLPDWHWPKLKDKEQFKEEVKKATYYLYDTVIPEFARHLEATAYIAAEEESGGGERGGGGKEGERVGNLEGAKGEDLTLMMHFEGINCRHLGRIFEELQEDCHWRETVMEEMIARTFKVLFFLFFSFLFLFVLLFFAFRSFKFSLFWFL
jgi:hypothetical protein